VQEPSENQTRVQQKLIRNGKGRIFRDMTYSLGEPTRIIIDTIEKPSAVLRDEFRELYKLNPFRLENFKYIQ
ncbi:3117_t:CDS:1, partial [Cetraspora pellucida]